MALLLRTLLALAIAAVALAAPKRAPKHKGFVLSQVAVNKGSLRSGTHAAFRAYQRYGNPVPAHVAKANTANNNTVAAIPEQYDSMYLTPVALGSGGRVVNLDLDTGSADFWSFSAAMTASERGGHDYYNPADSASSKKLDGASWQISYGDGTNAKGDVYMDKVSLAGVTAENQAIGAADDASIEFLQDPNSDGLVGLAFSSLNSVVPRKQLTFFDNVKASLPEPIFAVDLRRGAPGTYSFGAVDTGAFTGPIYYAPVDAQRTGLWHFTAAGYGVGTDAVNTTPVEAVADTGSSVMYLPNDIVRDYYSQVEGAKYSNAVAGWSFACDAKMPDFRLKIADYEATVPGSYINYAPNEDGSGTCFGGIQPAPGTPFAVLGDVFLKSQYVVFNQAPSPLIGFAKKPL